MFSNPFYVLLVFIFSITTVNILKVVINYDNYKQVMVNQMEQNLEEIKENLKKQDLTYEEKERRLENYRKIYLMSISLPIIVLSNIAFGIFLLPIIMLVQAFAFSMLFFIFPNSYKGYNFKKLFLILIYSKTAILLGAFLSLIFSIIYQNPTFSFNFSNFIPYEFVSHNSYLKAIRNTLYHIEPFSILSLILLIFGLNKAFDFEIKKAVIGVFGIFIIFLILNALFFLLFFK
ncbi:MAG: hypothetical protein ABIL49_01190 [candidate division WOR-3 bacterium]